MGRFDRKQANPVTLVVDAVQRSYQLWLTTKERFTPTERQRLFGLTILIGAVCGVVAVAFHESIRFVEALTIERGFDADPWIPWVIGIPVAGALVAGIALAFIPGARGSGIPQVKIAYATTAIRLRIRDSIGKFAIGALQIGTGSSLGREGPTVQICSGIAKAMGRLIGVQPQNLRLLLPVGSAAGIAAAFNAPIAAVTFTIEEIVGNLDQTLLSGVIVAAAIAAVVERSILGEHPVFTIPHAYGLDHPSSLVVYAALGIAAALVSVAFTESLLWVRARFGRATRLPVWLRPSIGGLVTATIAVTMMAGFGAGGITGGGYATLSEALSGNLGLQLLLVLGAAKLVATVFSYSSGGAGGIFAPALFIGAMLGGAFGALDIQLFDHGDSELGAFALVGMGAVFAGTVRAPITSVLIIIEMTNGYGLALPLMISNMMAYGLARRLRPTPIYDALLEQDGTPLHAPKPADTLDGLTIGLVPLEDVSHLTFAPTDQASAILAAVDAAGRQEVFPVCGADGGLAGIITLEDITGLADEPDPGGLIRAADIMRPAVGLREHELVHRALETMSSLGVRELPVIDADGKVRGMIDESEIAHAYLRARAKQRETS